MFHKDEDKIKKKNLRLYAIHVWAIKMIFWKGMYITLKMKGSN